MSVVHFPTQTHIHINNAIKTEEYHCSKCNNRMFIRKGLKRLAHFYHRIKCKPISDIKPKISKCLHCNHETKYINDYIWLQEYADKVFYYIK